MPVYLFAGVPVAVENRYAYQTRLSRDYLAADQKTYAFRVRADENEMARDKADKPYITDGYAESLSIGRAVAWGLLDHDAFLLHAAVTVKEGYAFVFLGKSGVGKTTHARFWKDRFPDARILCGDKPFIRIIDGKVFAYGSPWGGKEGFQINEKAPVKALAFLERSPQNLVTPIAKAEAVKRLFPSLLLSDDPAKLNKLLDLVQTFVDKTPTCRLQCNLDPQAAEVAFNAMMYGV